jgi:hypothetical protein
MNKWARSRNLERCKAVKTPWLLERAKVGI